MLLDKPTALRSRGVAETIYGIAWKLGMRLGAPKVAQRAIFERIYDTNTWGGAESRSGPGSTRARGAELAPALLELFASHSVGTLLDAPCGDFNWMRDIAPHLASYVGVDIVEELIADNNARYGE